MKKHQCFSVIAFLLVISLLTASACPTVVKAYSISSPVEDILDFLNGGNSSTTTENADSLLLRNIPSSKVTNLKVVSTQMDSINLSWSPSADADWYVISYWATGNASSAVTLTNVGNVTSYTLGGLSQSEYVIYVMPAKKLENGELVYSSLLNYTSIKCAPTAKAPTGFSVANIGTGYCSFTVSGLGSTDTSFYDTEVLLYDYSGKQLGSYYGQPTSVSISDTRIKKNRFYSAKVRGYYQLADGTKIAGAWSKRIYFAVSLKKVSGNAVGKKISLSWSAVKGASNYSVYVKTSTANSFKKVKTTKKTAYTVTKYRNKALVKGKIYYIKIVANKKKNGNIYKCISDKYKVTI